MAKTKYKLGTFVKTAETDDMAPHYGAVEEIHLTTTGVSYKLTGLEEAVSEDAIEQGYRAIVSRKTQTRTSTKRGKKERTSQAQAAA